MEKGYEKACASFEKLYNTQQFMPFKDWEDEKFASWVKSSKLVTKKII